MKITDEDYKRIYQIIIDDIKSKDTDRADQCGYGDCWRNFLSDGRTVDEEDDALYEEILYTYFTDEELEALWNESH